MGYWMYILKTRGLVGVYREILDSVRIRKTARAINRFNLSKMYPNTIKARREKEQGVN